MRDLAKVAETALDTNELAMPDGRPFPVEDDGGCRSFGWPLRYRGRVEGRKREGVVPKAL